MSMLELIAANESLKIPIIKKPLKKPSGFGDIFVLIVTKGQQSTNWKSLLWKTKEGESNRELAIMSLQWLLLSSTQAQKTAISGSPNMVKRQWGLLRMSHQTPTLTSLACVQDREGEKAGAEKGKHCRADAHLQTRSFCLNELFGFSNECWTILSAPDSTVHVQKWLIGSLCIHTGKTCPLNAPNERAYSRTGLWTMHSCNCCFNITFLPKCTFSSIYFVLYYELSFPGSCQIMRKFNPCSVCSKDLRELQIARGEGRAPSSQLMSFVTLSGFYQINGYLHVSVSSSVLVSTSDPGAVTHCLTCLHHSLPYVYKNSAPVWSSETWPCFSKDARSSTCCSGAADIIGPKYILFGYNVLLLLLIQWKQKHIPHTSHSGEIVNQPC